MKLTSECKSEREIEKQRIKGNSYRSDLLRKVNSVDMEAVPAGRLGVPKDRPLGLLPGKALLLANDEPKLRPPPLLPLNPVPDV